MDTLCARHCVPSGWIHCVHDTVFLQDGYTALHIAARSNRVEIMKMLLNKKAEVNAQEKVKRFPGASGNDCCCCFLSGLVQYAWKALLVFTRLRVTTFQ
eukprot:scaffold159823_cov22-Tisochrysis_lutea.AAC.1